MMKERMDKMDRNLDPGKLLLAAGVIFVIIAMMSQDETYIAVGGCCLAFGVSLTVKGKSGNDKDKK